MGVKEDILDGKGVNYVIEPFLVKAWTRALLFQRGMEESPQNHTKLFYGPVPPPSEPAQAWEQSAKGRLSPPVGLWDYKVMRKAAFQFGVEMQDARKTRKKNKAMGRLHLWGFETEEEWATYKEQKKAKAMLKAAFQFGVEMHHHHHHDDDDGWTKKGLGLVMTFDLDWPSIIEA